MNLKKQRFTLIILLSASMLMHLVYGLEGQAQVSELQHKIDKQEAQLRNKNIQIEVQDMILEVQDELINESLVKKQNVEPKENYVEDEYTITAYCPCEKCCGKYALNRPNGVVYGASGIELQEGVSVASPLPFGTKIIIDGHEYISQDRTSEWIAKKYDDKIIDVYFEKHEDAVKFGNRIAKVYIVEAKK